MLIIDHIMYLLGYLFIYLFHSREVLVELEGNEEDDG